MLTEIATLLLVALVFAADVMADAVVIRSGNVIGSPRPGDMAHHMHQTQHDFAQLVSVETDGEVTFEILEGKRPDIPVYAMPGMAQEGTVIQATAVPSFFLPKVHELKIFEIPYLFDDAAHAQRYPASDIADDFSSLIEERYGVKVLGHFLVAHNVAITSTNRLMILPQDFAGRYINDDFESFAPMWENIKPARRYSIGFTEAVDGALHDEKLLDTSIGMLQNIYAQKQYTKFHFATVAPSFYTFFYTFILNSDVWNSLDGAQQAGVLRAARAAEKLAFVNEQATATYHRALNRSLGMTLHEQTPGERAAWATEFSDKVRNGILQNSDSTGTLSAYVEGIRDLK